MSSEQIAYPCSIFRGGTSRAAFFQEKDLPPAGPERDYVLLRLMGWPDKLQIDGIGGGQIASSKIAIVGPPSISGADIDYTFGQISPEHGTISYQSNCGNIAAAVAPYAIDTGLVEAISPETFVRIHNTNTRTVYSARVPVRDGVVRTNGNFAMAGVPGAGAEIELDYRETLGAITGTFLPTGKVCEEIRLSDGRSINVSICDAGNLGVFVSAVDLGLTGTELPKEIDGNAKLLAIISEIKNRAAERAGLVDDWKKADPQLLVPFVAVVARPNDYVTSEGRQIRVSEQDLLVRVIVRNICHPSFGGTLAVCTAACAAIPGSIPNRSLVSGSSTLRIAHPKGVMPVKAILRNPKGKLNFEFEQLSYSRTARLIMKGEVYMPTPDQGDGLTD